MRILLVSSSYNSLSQHAHVALTRLGHEVSVELFLSERHVRDGVALFKPDLVLCPMLKQILPEDVWHSTPCIIVHPGITGDRGSSSLDWAILRQDAEWGVTAVQAAHEVDSGPIWASRRFAMRPGSKSSLYRDELTVAAVQVIIKAVQRFDNGLFVPEPLDYTRPEIRGRYCPTMPQTARATDWATDSVATIVTKIRSADSNPGVLDTLFDEQYYLYGACREGKLVGPPGKVLAQRDGAICRAATDGAVWISHLKKAADKSSPAGKRPFKLPAAVALGDHLDDIPELPLPLLVDGQVQTFKEIWYEEQRDVGYLYFEFYNGAMGTAQCQRLTHAFLQAAARPTKVLVLMGGRDFWSNGIHLNLIEAAQADGPNGAADESWRNINAMDDLVRAIIDATDKIVISAMHGSAGAGGVMFALAADKVFVRDGVVLNPHYRSMGGLYGSEYWTYLLPRRVGKAWAERLTNRCLPLGCWKAKELGLIDDVVQDDDEGTSTFHRQISRIAEKIAHDPDYSAALATKREAREHDEHDKPLERYRAEELEKMWDNFYGEDHSYHVARAQFVHKVTPSETPLYLARHRRGDDAGPGEPM
ncbi:hydrogenase maturation protein [Andreprevotia chitinilytica]|uniref:hydrogenase maturation protein n=1 Tax=Andreprevotia chitinilytica TaxID=396808 RepID=UPI000554BAF8|nr:hydrogenase maturation protein [Andreprevotia chitinilytica]